MSNQNDVRLSAVYVRKSTEEDTRQIESFAGQEREITKFAEANGYIIVKSYREAFTGTEVKRRKVFLEMLNDARTKNVNFSYILCYDISRFGRLDNDEAGYYRHEFRKHGVEIIYVTENLQGDDTDDLIVSTKQWLAREYSRKIGEYVCRNIVSRAGDAKDKARAFNIGRAAPFGYDTVYIDKDGNPHTIVRWLHDRSKEVYDIDGKLLRVLPAGTRFQKADTDLIGLIPSLPERVETIRKMFRLYVDENLGQYAIVNRLNKALKNNIGCASPTGKPWSIGTVQQILQNEHYIGNTVFNKRSMGKFFRLTVEGDGVKTERLPKHMPTTIRHNNKKDWIILEGTHEPLVSKDIFEAAKAKRKIRCTDKSQSRRSLGSKYLFSGKIKCGNCGFHFQGATKKKNGKEKEGYICGGYKLRGKHTCDSNFLPSNIIEPAVFDALDQEVKSMNLSGVIGRANRDLSNAPALAQQRRGDLKRELCTIEERLETLVDCITPENKDIISGKMVSLRKERDRINLELANTSTIEKKIVASTKVVERLVKLASELKELWAVATLPEKKEFVSLMVDSISIQPKKKTAHIMLSSNYLELKQLATPSDAASFLYDCRGNWPNFEPKPAVVAPVVSLFLKPPSPYLFMATRIIRESA
ncbi:MAG: recombinase family protein [Planctomycetota bacterium]|nr:MAG: recombinase family protein [Planctomycetota bacterium]